MALSFDVGKPILLKPGSGTMLRFSSVSDLASAQYELDVSTGDFKDATGSSLTSLNTPVSSILLFCSRIQFMPSTVSRFKLITITL